MNFSEIVLITWVVMKAARHRYLLETFIPGIDLPEKQRSPNLLHVMICLFSRQSSSALLEDDLEKWNKQTLNKKLDQLADVITDMNDGKGPDILGVCEIENEDVLDKLRNEVNKKGTEKGNQEFMKRDYQIMHNINLENRYCFSCQSYYCQHRWSSI